MRAKLHFLGDPSVLKISALSGKGVHKLLPALSGSIDAYRTRVPSGIAAGTWWLAGFEGALWGYYGWWYSDVPIVLFAIVALAGSAVMLARFYATRHRWERVPAAA